MEVLSLGSAKIHKLHLQVTTKFIKFIWKMQFTNGMKNQCFLLCKNFQKSTCLNRFHKLLMENWLELFEHKLFLTLKCSTQVKIQVDTLPNLKILWNYFVIFLFWLNFFFSISSFFFKCGLAQIKTNGVQIYTSQQWNM